MGFGVQGLQEISLTTEALRTSYRRFRASDRGTIQKYSHQSEAETYVAKAQEVALDRTLVDRFKNGDQAAFDEMVTGTGTGYTPMVHQLLRNQQGCGRGDTGCVHRAHRGLAEFPGRLGIFNMALPNRHQSGPEPLLVLVAQEARQVGLDRCAAERENDMTLADVLPAEVESPDDITVTQEFVNRIGKGMERLSTKHREILVLRNVKNMSYEEIAAILAISVGTVKSRIARARESLRSKLGEDFK